MPDSFAQGANARNIGSKEHRPRILVVCPPTVNIEEVRELKYAGQDAGCMVNLYRTGDDFRLSDLVVDIRDKSQPHSHLVLMLGHLNSCDDTVLAEAELAGIKRIALFPVHYRDSLTRHEHKIRAGKIEMIFVRTPADEEHVRTRWEQKIPAVLVEDVKANAAIIFSELLKERATAAAA